MGAGARGRDEGEKMGEKWVSKREEMEDGLSIAVSTLNLRLALPNPALRLSSRGARHSPDRQVRPIDQIGPI